MTISIPSLCLLVPLLTVFLQQYLDKRLFVQLNGSRKVIGVLRGYDVRSSFESEEIAATNNLSRSS